MPFPSTIAQNWEAAAAEYERVAGELAQADLTIATITGENTDLRTELTSLETERNNWQQRALKLAETLRQRDASRTIAQNEAARTIRDLEHAVEARESDLALLRVELAEARSGHSGRTADLVVPEREAPEATHGQDD